MGLVAHASNPTTQEARGLLQVPGLSDLKKIDVLFFLLFPLFSFSGLGTFLFLWWFLLPFPVNNKFHCIFYLKISLFFPFPSPTSLLRFSLYVCVCMHVYLCVYVNVWMHGTFHVWWSEPLMGVGSLFLLCEFWNQTQIIRLGAKLKYFTILRTYILGYRWNYIHIKQGFSFQEELII